MLNFVHIQNFRLFKDFQIDDLARVNLIVGNNNAGKSSLLEAIYLLTNNNPVASLQEILINRGETISNESFFHGQGFRVNDLFYEHYLRNDEIIINGDEERNYRLKTTRDRKENNNDLYLVLSTKDKVERLELLGNTVDSHQFLRRARKFEIDDSVGVTNITTKGIRYSELSKLWDGIQLTPKEDYIITLLNILDTTISRVSFPTGAFSISHVLVKKDDVSVPLPIGSMGDGMSRVLAIGITLANSENGFLLIDEIDTGLHYRALTDMWRVVMETAVRLNIQVFATTHSYDCMRSFAEALSLMEDDSVGALFRLQRRGEKIESARYEAERITFSIEQEIEIR